mgnify:CR=1 FL=1
MNTILVYSSLNRFNTEPSDFSWAWIILITQQILFIIFSISILVRRRLSILLHLAIPIFPAIIILGLAFLDYLLRGFIIRPTIVLSANSVVYVCIIIISFQLLNNVGRNEKGPSLIDQDCK